MWGVGLGPFRLLMAYKHSQVPKVCSPVSEELAFSVEELEKEYEKVEKPKKHFFFFFYGLERVTKRYLKTFALPDLQGFLRSHLVQNRSSGVTAAPQTPL